MSPSDRPTSAIEAWNTLTVPWQTCFDQAWTSWCEGDFGIGAVLVDPESDAIISVGRNRIRSQPADPAVDGSPPPLANTFLAHAEMNAFATLSRYKADGLHLYTTLQPCLMCEATAVLMHTKHIHYAAEDALFGTIEGWWEQHPYASRRLHGTTGPLQGALAMFALVLPLTRSAVEAPNKKVMLAAKAATPLAASLAVELVADNTLTTLHRMGATTQEALADLWPRLLVR